MSRSWDQFHYTRGGDCGGEYTSKRMGGNYPVAGRFTKTLTHRVERREARLEIENALQEAQGERLEHDDAPVAEAPVEVPQTLYVVVGYTGEFSDSAQWLVCGYLDQAKAERRAAQLNDLAHALMPHEGPEFYDNLLAAADALREADPNGSMDYTGTWYAIEEVPVVLG